MQEPVFDLTALAHSWLLDAVAAHCDMATLRALCLASRAACAATRRTRSTIINVPRERAAKLVVALAAGRLPAVRAIRVGSVADFPNLWPPPAALLEALPRLTTLRALYMTCVALGPAGVAQLAACTQLESLELLRCPELGDDGGRALAAALTRLTCLDVRDCGLTAGGAAAVAALPRLQRLDITSNLLRDSAAALSALTAGLTHLCACSVSCPGLLHHLRGLTQLESLDVRAFWHPNVFSLRQERAAVEQARAHVTALTSMRRLRDLSGPPLDDGAVIALAGALTALTGLTSFRAQGLTGRGLAALGRLPLVELTLQFPRAWGAAPTGLAPLAPTLRALELQQAGVDDEGAAAIAQLTGLTSLDLAANRITGAGVAALAGGLAGLRKLNLGHNPAGAATVGPLSALTALSWLSVDYSYGHADNARFVAFRALLHCTELVRLHLARGAGLSKVGEAALREMLPLLQELTVGPYDPQGGEDGGGGESEDGSEDGMSEDEDEDDEGDGAW